MKFKLLPALLSLCLILGCASSGKRRAIECAIQTMSKEYGLTDCKVVGASRVAGHWRVKLLQLPETPGGWTEVDVSNDGKVLKVQGGM